MIRLSGILVHKDGQEGQVQVTLLGEDGTPMRYEYAGEVFATVNATSHGYLSVHVSVTPSRHEVVTPNSASSRFTK